MKKPLPEREQEMLDLIQSLKAQLVERGNVIHLYKLHAEAALEFLTQASSGLRYDPSWTRPKRMTREEMDCACIQAYHELHQIFSENQTPKEHNQNEPVSTPETNGHRRPESTGPVVHRQSPDEFSGAGGPQERTQLQAQSNSPADTYDTSGNSAVDTGGTT